MAIPEELIDQVQERVDIVEVISGFVPLKKAGRNYRANCPFHNEKTPSFIVSPDKQIYHCFGCGAGGNVFNFLMRFEKMEFREAVEFLAKKCGIAIPALRRESGEELGLHEMLYKVNDAACSYYQDQLLASKMAMEYLTSRGVGAETMKTFRIGFAPDAWEGLLNFFRKKKMDEAIVEKAGLIIPNQKGGHYDRFRSRLTFPIFDARGNILGFGARVLDSSLPKYMNSPETPVYQKGKNLYGLNFSKNHIREKKYALIVEGYMDFIIPYQAGVRNIVATLGTALTQDQVRLLKRHANTVIMIFDPDEAGEAASVRNLDIFISEGVNVYITTLEKGYDPDSFIRKFGAEEFEACVKRAKNLFDYKMDLLRERHDARDTRGKVNIANEMLPTIARITNEVMKSALIKRLAEELSVDEASLKAELKKVRPDYAARAVGQPAAKQKDESDTFRSAEKLVLALMLEEGRFIDSVKASLAAEDFRDEAIRKIVSAIFSFHGEGKAVSAGRLINHLNDERASGIISEVATLQGVVSDRERALADCIDRMKKEKIGDELSRLQVEIKDAYLSQDERRWKELAMKYNDLVKLQKAKRQAA